MKILTAPTNFEGFWHSRERHLNCYMVRPCTGDSNILMHCPVRCEWHRTLWEKPPRPQHDYVFQCSETWTPAWWYNHAIYPVLFGAVAPDFAFENWPIEVQRAWSNIAHHIQGTLPFGSWWLECPYQEELILVDTIWHDGYWIVCVCWLTKENFIINQNRCWTIASIFPTTPVCFVFAFICVLPF